MIPQGGIEDLTTTREASKTYLWDQTNNRIKGFTDGIDAIEQAIYKMLSTERYQHIIYSFNYGVEFEALIGKDDLYKRADIKRRIEEALTQDDRIERIENFTFLSGVEKDSMVITFDAITVNGVLNIESEVKLWHSNIF